MLLAVSKASGKNCECIPHIAIGLQGGLMAGEVCGAVSGAVLALGLLYGADQDELVTHLTGEFVSKFAEENGSVRCIDIVGFNISGTASGDIDLSNVMGIVTFLARGGKRHCNRIVSSAVRVLLEQINEWES